MTSVRTVSPSCRSQTTVACKHCHSEALVCGTIGEATARMEQELETLRQRVAASERVVEAAREALTLLYDEATDESRCATEVSGGMYRHALSQPCRDAVRAALAALDGKEAEP